MRRSSCDNCGSSDGVGIYSDGHSHCFVCSTTLFAGQEKGGESIAREIEPFSASKPVSTPLPTEFHALTDRRIGRATAEKFQVGFDKETLDHLYPYFDQDGRTHVASKFRHADKTFHMEGPIKEAGLFGQQLFQPGSAKFITLVEGECDAMAAYELMGSRWPVVSVKNGAAGAAKDVANAFEYLNSFGTIVICFDKDEPKTNPVTGAVHYPGQEAAVTVAGMFAIGKVKILTLAEAKDPNDYLVKGLREQFNKEWWSAPGYTPTGLKRGSTMWDEVSAPKEYETVPYPFEGLNKQTYGIRLSELITVTADTGVGKTSVLKEIEYFILKNVDKAGIGLLHLEEPNSDTALGLMSIEANRPLHLPDVRSEVTTEELRSYFDGVINTDRLVVYDHFGSNSVQEILNKIRHMVTLGCKYIVLDHLSIVVSDQSGDERKQLDEISTKIKTLCMELNISVIVVIHQNRQGQIRGTAGVEQLSNIVFKLHRDKMDIDPWRRNVTKITTEKNRFCGRTGPGTYVFYREETGRLEELTDEQVAAYESGSSANIDTWS